MEAKIKKISLAFAVLIIFSTFFSKTLFHLFIPFVVTGEAAAGRINQSAEADGAAKSCNEVRLKALYGGFIETVLAKEGDRAESGGPLIVYNREEEEHSLAADKIELEKMKNNLNGLLAQREGLENPEEDEDAGSILQLLEVEEEQINLSRLQEILLEDLQNAAELQTLYEAGAISRKEYEAGLEKVRESKAALEAAEREARRREAEREEEKAEKEREKEKNGGLKDKELEALGYSIKEAELDRDLYTLDLDFAAAKLEESYYERAKEAVLITKILVEPGQRIEPMDEIFVVETENDEYSASFQITDGESKLLSLGEEVTLFVKGRANVSATGRIEEISATGQADNRKEVKVVFSGKDFSAAESLRLENQLLTLRIQKQSEMYDYIVPNTALRYDGKNYYVLSLTEEKTALGLEYYTRKIPVYILDRNDEEAAISSSWDLRGKLVFESEEALEDKQRVNLYE